MRTIPEIQSVLDVAAKNEQAFLDSLTSEERSVGSSFEHWSAKDLLAHISYWRQQMADKIRQLTNPEFDPWNQAEGDDSRNLTVYQDYRNAPWEDVHRMMKESVSNLKAALGQANPAELANPDLDPWHEGREPWRSVVSEGFTHPSIHIGQYLVEHGYAQRALSLQQEATDTLLTLDDSPDMRGMTIYNLACFQALLGESEQALENLREALGLSPRLIDWSKKDPDLVSLRSDPKYQALYEG